MDYLQLNKQLWNERTVVHLDSEFYEMEAFRAGKNALKEIELNLLGNISGKSVLHLQCHFGQDTLSMARMGARVTGVDFSEKAIETAAVLSKDLNLPAEFICCDVYSLPQLLDRKFDIVFTSYGTIGWLPDIDKWAAVVAHFLGEGGRFVFAEFHPVVWMFDNDFRQVTYKYSKSEPIVEDHTGTYADPNAPIQHRSVSWNHGLAEVIGALLKQGLQIKQFQEFDYSPYNCFPDTEEVAPGKFQTKNFGDKIPMVYALEAIKK